MFKIKTILRLSLLLTLGTQSCRSSLSVEVDSDNQELALFSSDDSQSLIKLESSSSKMILAEKRISNKVKKLGYQTEEGRKAALNLAQILLIKGDLNKSEKTVRRVLIRDLNNKDAKIILADVFYRRDLVKMSKMILDSIDGSASLDSRVLNLLGLIELNKGDNHAALLLFKKALKNNPNDLAVRMNLGLSFLQYRQLKEAAVQFERVLAVMPEHPDANLHMATIYAVRGQWKKSVDIYEDVLSSNSSNSVALYNYASLLYDKKKYSRGLDVLNRYIDTIAIDNSNSKNRFEALALAQKFKSGISSQNSGLSSSRLIALAKQVSKKARRKKKLANKKYKKKSAKFAETVRPTKKFRKIKLKKSNRSKRTKTFTAKNNSLSKSNSIKSVRKVKKNKRFKQRKKDKIEDLERIITR
jgi:Tfp pilus assembly protein PilF